MHPTAVVVDYRDGYTWSKGFDGELLNETTAIEMAQRFNDERKPEYRTYKVFVLHSLPWKYPEGEKQNESARSGELG
jgi:hypothetical protein